MRHSAIVIFLTLTWSAPLSAQLTKDFQVHGAATVFAQRFAGGGVGFSIRPPGRARFGINASAGDLEGQVAGRVGLLASFHLNPVRERGVAPYAAAGVAVEFTGTNAREYLELLLGLEQTPGRRAGWFAEAGAGGGLKLSAGYRFRWGSGVRN